MKRVLFPRLRGDGARCHEIAGSRVPCFPVVAAAMPEALLQPALKWQMPGLLSPEVLHPVNNGPL